MASTNRQGAAGRRLMVASVFGFATLVVALAVGSSWSVSLSLSFCVVSSIVLVWTWLKLSRMNADETMSHARAEDLSRGVADLVLIGASVASLVAVAFTLVQAGDTTGHTKAELITLAIATVVLAWLSVHSVYIARYGDLYYRDDIGGIDFNDPDFHPDYHDFAYLGVTIGMTYQVSDTTLQTQTLRRTALRHALLSYLFGAVILAVTINVVASLLST